MSKHVKLFVPTCVAAACFLVSVGFSRAAWAEQRNVIEPFVGYSVAYESNLFKKEKESSSDVLQRLDAGVLVEKKLGLQRISGSLSTQRALYSTHSELDYTGRNLAMNWAWSTTPRITGNLGFSNQKTLTPFVNNQTGRDLRVRKSFYVDGGWLFHPSWRVWASHSHNELDYELLTSQNLDRNEDTGALGLDYVLASGNTVGLQVDRTRGYFPSLISRSENYIQNGVQAKVVWGATEKTKFEFLGGMERRSYDDPLGQDFSGLQLKTSLTLHPTAKTDVVFSVWRDASAYDGLTTQYTVNKGISVTPGWDLTAKLRLQGFLRAESREGSRTDHLNYSSLGFVYVPVSKLRLNLEMYRDHRSSTDENYRYTSRGIAFQSRYQF